MMRELQNVSVVSQSISDQIISFPQVGEGCPKEGGNCRTGEDMDGRFRDFYSLRQESGKLVFAKTKYFCWQWIYSESASISTG